MPMTNRQKEVLESIKNWHNEKGYPPTLSNIGNILNISVGTVQSHLLALQKKGYINWNPNEARTLTIIKELV